MWLRKEYAYGTREITVQGHPGQLDINSRNIIVSIPSENVQKKLSFRQADELVKEMVDEKRTLQMMKRHFITASRMTIQEKDSNTKRKTR